MYNLIDSVVCNCFINYIVNEYCHVHIRHLLFFLPTGLVYQATNKDASAIVEGSMTVSLAVLDAERLTVQHHFTPRHSECHIVTPCGFEMF